MKKNLLSSLLIFCAAWQSLFAQINLNWNSSYSPAWANGDMSGTASNIGGNSISCSASVSITGPGNFTNAMGSFGAQTPTVSGAVFTIPGASNRLQITTNYNQNTSYTTVVLSFTSYATNVFFRIADIDKNDPNSTTYFDRVTITGSNGSTTFNPVITKYDAVTDPNFLIISGNTAHVNTTGGQAGNTASDATDQRGTVNVNFGTASINSITIRYDNAPGANNNTASQSVAIGQVSFNQSILPSILTDFSGYRQGRNVALNWKTSQEINSAFFELERSYGSSWEKIGTVAAAGFSSSELRYSFTDINPQGSLLLYRLKQVDKDDKYKYSGIVRINAAGTEKGITAYPNPFNDQFSASVYSPLQQSARVVLVDVSGRVMKSENRNLYAGDNNMLLSGLGTLPKGIYQVIAYDISGNQLGSTKLLKE